MIWLSHLASWQTVCRWLPSTRERILSKSGPLGRRRSLDLDGDGRAGASEAVWRLFAEVTGATWLTGREAVKLLVDFDSSDAPWLQGYCHVLMAMADFLLAHEPSLMAFCNETETDPEVVQRAREILLGNPGNEWFSA